MACKQGIRQHIEAAKVYYQQQRQPDSFRDYWTALVHRVHDTPDGFYRLSHSEQTYYLVTVLQGCRSGYPGIAVVVSSSTPTGLCPYGGGLGGTPLGFDGMGRCLPVAYPG